MKMKSNRVYFENSVLKICYYTEKFKAVNYWMKQVLLLFWEHPSIDKLFLIKMNEREKVMSKICVLDKAEYQRIGEFFVVRTDGRE